METVRKQALGIDVSKDELVVCLSHMMQEDGRVEKVRGRKFANTYKGFEALVIWLTKHALADVHLVILMEATGVYHENLAYFLYDHDYNVCIELANKVKAFGRSLNAYSKTDKIDAQLIAHMAAERNLETWQPSSSNMLMLKALSRQREQLIAQRTRTRNQLHAHRHSVCNCPTIEQRYQALIEQYQDLEKQIEREMKQLVEAEQAIEESVERLTSIHGIGLITALTVLAEMDGFALFTSRSQVVRYAGYDVEVKQSGSSLHGQGRISKRGNAHIRRALYMPSITAISQPGIFKDTYDRIVERTGKAKMGLVAVQRKLLTTMFALHKNGTSYDVDHYKTSSQKGVGKPDDLPTVATPLQSALVA